ncbi:MAG: ribonuclease III [Pseudomonadota bacterium]
MDQEALGRKLGYTFHRPELLRQALTHRSHSTPHNERLEFLGDSVLNCCIARELYDLFPQLAEGELSRMRAGLVNQQTLFELAMLLGLGEEVRLGEGELKSGGNRRPSILADAFEAILGSIFLDGGFTDAQATVQRLFAPLLKEIDPATQGKDAKTLLQEYLQGRKLALPQYHIIATHGEAHEQVFEVECVIPALAIRTTGEGGSRRNAEQNAAKAAYQLVTAR